MTDLNHDRPGCGSNDGFKTNPACKLVVRVIAYSFIGWFFLSFNPFGIGDKSDQATQDALYKIAAPFYDSAAQQDIVIVLLNQSSITELFQRGAIEANEWPIRYRDHGYLLSRIIKYRPRAVFFDIYFKQKRSTDDSFEQFARRAGRVSEKFRSPLLFAGGYEDEQLSGIQQKLDELGELALSGWSDYDQAYPLKDNGKLSMAYRLYQLACVEGKPLASCTGPILDDAEVEDGDAVSVRWGNRPGKVVFPEFSKATCPDNSGSLLEVGRQLFSGFIQDLVNYGDEENPVEAQCAYHPVIYADELVYVDKAGTQEQKSRLEAALKDKVVMYGLSLEGLHDNVYSPVHGLLPGVFFHAMALDNLMHYGDDYVHATDDRIAYINQGIWIAMTIIFSLVLFCYERMEYAYNDGCERWLNYEDPGENISAFRLFWIASLTIIAISIGLFLFVRYEPLNSIGFLVLIGVSSGLVHSNFAEKVLSVLEALYRALPFSWLDNLFEWLQDLPSRIADSRFIKGLSWLLSFSWLPGLGSNKDEEASATDKTEAFYKEVFGLDLERGWLEACGSTSTGSATVYIDPEKGSCMPAPELVIEVDNIEVIWGHLKASDIEIEHELQTEPCGIRRFCIRDPLGKRVKIFQNKD